MDTIDLKNRRRVCRRSPVYLHGLLAAAALALPIGTFAASGSDRTAIADQKDFVRERTGLFVVAETINRVVWDARHVSFNGPRVQPVLGNGAVISADGYVLTARHVIGRALAGGGLKPWLLLYNHGEPRAVPGEVVWESADADLALVKVALTDAPHFEWSHPVSPLEKGTPVMTGGLMSFGRTGKVIFAEKPDGPEKAFVPLYYSARSRAGDSGAGVVDGQGGLIGIISARSWLAFTEYGFLLDGGKVIRPNLAALEERIREDRAKTAASPNSN